MGRPDGSHWFYSYFPQGIAGGATSALIPLFAYALGGSLLDVGAIAAATSVASVPAFILWGSLSDRLARRKAFLLIGFAGNASCLLGMALSPDLPAFYVANLVMGFLGAAAGTVVTVLIMETWERAEWPSRLALLSRMTAVGWTAGLGLGVGWLFLGSHLVGAELRVMRGLFTISSALGFLATFFAAAWTREPKRQINRDEVRLVDIQLRVERGRYLPTRRLHYFDPRTLRRGPRLPRPLRVYLVSVLLMFGGFTAFYAFFPIFLLQAVGLSSSSIFAVYIASQASSIAFYPRVARLIASRGSRSLQLYAAFGRGVLFPSFFLLGLVPLPSAAWLAVAIVLHGGVGACWAVINVTGSTLVSRLAPEAGRGQAIGAYNAVQGFGSIFGPLLGGFIAGAFGYAAAFGVSTALVLAGCVVLAGSRGAEP